MPIFVDLDGVLVDFMAGALAVHGKPDLKFKPGIHSPAKQLGISNDEFSTKIEAKADFWETLKPYDFAHDLMTKIEQEAGHNAQEGDGVTRHEIILLTTPARDPLSVVGKIRWVEHHFPKYKKLLMIGRCKWACAQPNALLIDDNAGFCDKFAEAGGATILFPRIWNPNHQYADRAVEFTMSRVLALTAMF